MKKFLLVTFIGLVLAINIYGIIDKYTVDETHEINHIDETTITVYVE